MERRRAPAVLAIVALAALAVRTPALAPDPTPDAAEYQMLARSLARGEGFVLPVRVRHVATGPVRHEARDERAPLFPAFLALLERLGLDSGPGIAPGLQVANALVGTLDAVLVAALAAELARKQGRRARGFARPETLALVAGLAAAWSPPLVQGSCRLLAEPLGLLFVLVAAHAELRLVRAEEERRSGLALGLALLQGLALVVARLARPESGVVLGLVAAARVVVLVRPRSARLAALVGTGLALGADALVSRAGWPPPQGFLLRVGSFRDVMFDWGAAPPVAPSVRLFVEVHRGAIAAKVAGNALDLGYHMVRSAHALPVLGALALLQGPRGARRLAALGLAFAAVASGAWATRDHARFSVIPLALLAAPAVLVGARVVRGIAVWARKRRAPLAKRPLRTLRGRLATLALAASALPLLLGSARATWKVFERARAGERESVWSGPELDALAARLRTLPPDAAFAAVSPWGLALASGRPGLLLPVRLDGARVLEFLRRYPEVRAVVLRPRAPHDRETREPVLYEDALAPVSSEESVAGASVYLLR